MLGLLAATIQRKLQNLRLSSKRAHFRHRLSYLALGIVHIP
ncbi:hypothetical protein ABIA06_005765 [Bradyrhizobium yuanmingense]|uniref:Transposase n=1 Tax=Bradyrhizobium yuanmingense TaxID=108015 RepID=A0A1C3WIJ4_9BRAD|nr:hypothetical protein IQ15_04556 [Bradyrhizobium yuanmingense]SCB39758.1 hypothetical protein GA0061099_1006205 [Bradyrhizobium yuanmingense]